MTSQETTHFTTPQAKEILDLAFSLSLATNIDHLLTQLAEKVTIFLHAEKIRLFAFDAVENKLYTKFKFHDVYGEMRFPVSNDTLAGYTAQNKQVVSVSDVRDSHEISKYPGMKYDAHYEEITGVRVRSILSVPLMLKGKELIGIIQLINTEDEKYRSDEAEYFLSHLGKIVAASIFNHDRQQHRAGKFDLLLEKGSISQDELNQAMRSAREHNSKSLEGDVVNVLLDTFNVPEYEMSLSLSRYYLTDFLPYEETRIVFPKLLHGLNLKYFFDKLAIPIAKEEGTLSILLEDPLDSEVINEIKTAVMAEHIKLYVGFRKDILKYIEMIKSAVQTDSRFSSLLETVDLDLPEEQDDEFEDILNETAPLIIQIVNKMIIDACEKEASDIHIEPGKGKEKTAVRFRIDGVCFPYTEFPTVLTVSIINRIKILAGLKLDEHRFPQSGKISLKSGHEIIELRVEVMPTVGGKEDVVLRILTRGSFLSLDDLDFSESNRADLLKIISKPYGILLAVGPTGSGKTTTLHAIINHLNIPEKKIWTVEDPVEITQKGLRQVQVNFNIKPEPFDFARAMRSFLRADPDIIMVGEMRDLETARIAVEASLTGHLVLSTLHTNSAVETVTRLVEMGIGSINISDSLLGVLAQRLVRVLCEDCKTAYTPDAEEIQTLLSEYGDQYVKELDLADGKALRLYQATGCGHCNHSGYRGRTSIHELLVSTPTIKKMIHKEKSSDEIKEFALSEGMRTLKMDGIRKVIDGKTTLKEVKSVCIE